jgi:hypothetical protein
MRGSVPDRSELVGYAASGVMHGEILSRLLALNLRRATTMDDSQQEAMTHDEA